MLAGTPEEIPTLCSSPVASRCLDPLQAGGRSGGEGGEGGRGEIKAGGGEVGVERREVRRGWGGEVGEGRGEVRGERTKPPYSPSLPSFR